MRHAIIIGGDGISSRCRLRCCELSAGSAAAEKRSVYCGSPELSSRRRTPEGPSWNARAAASCAG
eukprot:6352325-Prymnesium_polylepis.1